MHDPALLAGQLRDADSRVQRRRVERVHRHLPGPAEFLWKYINLTPMGPLVADAPDEAKAALERQVVDAWTPAVVNGRTPVQQPMALASGSRT